MPFLTDLVTRRKGYHQFMLDEPLVYRGRHQTFIVPAGFVTDFASVPWFVAGVLPRMGRGDLAAVLHDYLCVDRAEARRDNRAALVSARDVDGIFRRVLREQGVMLVPRWLYWYGVRLGALLNPARRSGWYWDAPLVLLITVLIVAPLVGLGFLVF